jgi:hypothetical protein
MNLLLGNFQRLELNNAARASHNQFMQSSETPSTNKLSILVKCEPTLLSSNQQQAVASSNSQVFFMKKDERSESATNNTTIFL